MRLFFIDLAAKIFRSVSQRDARWRPICAQVYVHTLEHWKRLQNLLLLPGKNKKAKSVNMEAFQHEAEPLNQRAEQHSAGETLAMFLPNCHANFKRTFEMSQKRKTK